MHLKYDLEKTRSCLRMNYQVLDCAQERNRNNRLIILDLEQQLEYRLRKMVEIESFKTPSSVRFKEPILERYITFNDLPEEQK